VPSDAEWTKLKDFLGSDAGIKMKNASGWNSYTQGGAETCPNCATWNAEYRRKVACHTCKDTREVTAPKVTKSGNGTNSSGFSGLPGGLRDYYGAFDLIGEDGCWWSSTEGGTISAWNRCLNYSNGDVGRGYGSNARGLSVRCIKD
jgi:uncharacterized protein (TIGR02145 family)